MTDASAGNTASSSVSGNRLIGPSSVAMVRRLAGILSLAILVTMTEFTAYAVTIRDGDRFSVSIETPGVRTCIFWPESARDPTECAGLTFPSRAPLDLDGVRRFGTGIVRLVDGSVAILSVTFFSEQDSTMPLPETFERDFEEAVPLNLPGATIRSGTSHVEIRSVAGLTTIRLSYDLDGLKSDRRRVEGHFVGYFTWAENGYYSVELQTGSDHAASVDALADSASLTLRVSHPGMPLPGPVARALKPLLALGAWVIFSVGTVINLLWQLLWQSLPHSARRSTPPRLASLSIGSAFLNATRFDISIPARLRKKIGSAAKSLKLIGLISAFSAAVYLGGRWGLASLFCAFAVMWFAFRLSKGLRSGSALSAAVASAWCVLGAGLGVSGAWRSLRAGLDGYSVIGITVFFILIGFLARGLSAFGALRAYQKSARNDPLAYHPWEEGSGVARHPRFVNKKSIIAHLLLLFSPVPYLFVWAANGGIVSNANVAHLLGQYIGGSILPLGALIWGTRIYRRARGHAMLPGSEVIKRDTRPMVLYLRSFHDDSAMKLRARANDGRILPERLLKIPFEELITDHLWGYGPVRAIANPEAKGQMIPLGAARDYIADARWQKTATNLMRQASMIVVIVGATQGLIWEIGTILEHGMLSKLILLFPPVGIEELKTRWQFLSNSFHHIFPAEIEFSRARAVVFPGGHPAVITGTNWNDWTYEAVLDEAALVIAHQPSDREVAPIVEPEMTMAEKIRDLLS